MVKFHTLTSSATILKIGYDLTKLQTVYRWEHFSVTQCRSDAQTRRFQ